MSQPANRAVFLSYASQDADAARRLCEALRGSGVEVWFDQNELTGGDAWDAKIRRQIKECALFVPLISANTQARREGYFRIEWKLAAQRTHAIADGTPFLLPVVIDATRDADALAPEEFRAVQWTRLLGGETSPAFCERVKRLLVGNVAGVACAEPVERADPGSSFGATGTIHPASARPATRRTLPLWAWAAAAILAVAIGLWAFRPMVGSSNSNSRTSEPKTQSPSAAQPPRDFAAAKSLVVLPFENRSPEPDSDFFADGVHEDVLTNLSYVRELTVVPRIIAMHYRGTQLRPRDLGAELHVANIVTGSVRRVGKTVRVTGQLIDARTEAATWTWQRDYELTDVMAIQSALATAIAGELRVALSPQEQKLIARRPTENVEAYDAYLGGRRASGPSSSASNRGERLALLEKAVVLDPKFAEAWAELARARSNAIFAGSDRTAGLVAKVTEAITTAQRLAPDSPEVIMAQGELAYRLHRDFARAAEYYERCIRLQPGNPEPWQLLGVVQRRLGKWSEALAAERKAVEIDPKFVQGWSDLANILRFGRRREEALVAQRRAAELNPNQFNYFKVREAMETVSLGGSVDELRAWLIKLSPSEAESDQGVPLRLQAAVLLGDYDEFIRLYPATEPRTLPLAWALAAKGDLAAARASLGPWLIAARQQLETDPTFGTYWSEVGLVEAVLGHGEEALRCAQKGVDLVPESRDAIDGPARSHDLAVVRAWTGDKTGAIAELGRLLLVPGTSTGFLTPLTVTALRRDPRYFPLWGDPRFEALLKDPKNNAPLF